MERYCDIERKCQICSEEAEIHHPNYNDYLKINLLCQDHHVQLHNYELIPPLIIDLEKIAVKIPPQKERNQYIGSQIENIKKDILEKDFSYKKLHEKYNISSQTIRNHLKEDADFEKIKRKLMEAGKAGSIKSISKNPENIIQKFRIENNLTGKEFSEITGIPEPTIRKIETGMTDINKIKPLTKNRLKKVIGNF